MPEFQACELDQWRNDKYLARRQAEQASREAIRQDQKRFEGGSRQGPVTAKP